MKIEIIHPEGWAAARGYSNGVQVEGAGRLLCVAGQVAWDAHQDLVAPGDFAGQFRQTLANVIAVVEAAGGHAEHLLKLTIYVTDKTLYTAGLKEVGAAYRDLMGTHYPAMALVQVADLLEAGALVEIEGMAALP